jgi:hypothetical protein
MKRLDLNPEGREFLIQSLSPVCAAEAATARRRPDWIRRKISLCDLCVSAVRCLLIFKRSTRAGRLNQPRIPL